MSAKAVFENLAQQLQPLFGAGEARSIAYIVMEDAFGLRQTQITDNQPFAEGELPRLQQIKERLLAHEPVQYVVGSAYFFGHFFKVTPAVLIPRQETEELVAWVLESVSSQKLAVGSRVLDIGTGSGCIPIAIKKALPGLEVHALDVSRAALAVAEENAVALGASLHFHEMDILNETRWPTLPDFEAIVSNPPYITEAERHLMPRHVLEHEPHLALFSGSEDALRFYRAISLFAKQKLRPSGLLFFETNEFNAQEVASMLRAVGFEKVDVRKDLNGKERMIKACNSTT